MQDINEKTNGAAPLSNNLLFPFTGGSGRADIFVEPGDSIEALFMRSNFTDERAAAAHVLLYDQLREFNVVEGIETLKVHIAAKCSIKGRSRLEALQAQTDCVVPSFFGGAGKAAVVRGGRSRDERDEHPDQAGRN